MLRLQSSSLSVERVDICHKTKSRIAKEAVPELTFGEVGPESSVGCV